jgi:type III secretion system export apparatus protein
MPSQTGLIALLSAATLAPFVFAVGSCFIKFSIVMVLVRNALGLQNVPSNLVLNGVALMLSVFVMMPFVQQAQDYLSDHRVEFSDRESLERFSTEGLAGYRTYLHQHAKPSLVEYFERLQREPRQIAPAGQEGEAARDAPRDSAEMDAASSSLAPALAADPETLSLFALLPAYALSEIEDAFRIGFYLYLPFVVIDLVVSSILLALGMMMMSPVTISIPIKLLLFVAMDGWTLLSRGLIEQYFAP